MWALVSDITNTGSFSPETFEAEWLNGSSAPAVGARFRGHVRRNGKRPLVSWTQSTIIVCQPGRDSAFQVEGIRAGRPVGKWRYHFEPSGRGTDVTESFELVESLATRFSARIAGRARTRANVDNMRATSERIRAAAEVTGGDV